MIDTNDEEKEKNKNSSNNIRNYWRFVIPLTFFLILMIKFPLRIDLRESLFDSLFYGLISLLCIIVAKRVYQRFGKLGHRLVTVILLCSILSGWQILDLYVLRINGLGQPSVLGFGAIMSPNYSEYDGLAWYAHRFPNDEIMCHSLFERYWGNYYIAITLEIKRDATWFACGG